MRRLLRSPSFLAALAVTVFTALVTVQVMWVGLDGGGFKETIRSDAKGYYGYLQAIFIRGDLGNEPMAWEYVQVTPRGTLNKYFCGTSLFMAPWFLIGHDLALGDPKARHDGLSHYEQMAIGVGGWVYLLLGLLALRALLLGMGVREPVVSWTLVALGLGTPLLQFAAVQPGWSHVYAFCAVSVLLLLVHRIAHGARPGWLVAAGAMLGLVVLIRPVNAMVLLGVPVVLGSATLPFVRGLFRRPGWSALALLGFTAVVFLQPLLWHLQTGRWIEWGYRNEGFYWTRPEVMNVLFSWRRGLFLWTPLMTLVLMGAFWNFLRGDRTRGGWGLLYWAAITYVIASWWIWYYGSGFGSRVFIDHYPVLVVPMALMLERFGRLAWTAARLFITTCIALLLVQFVQFNLEVLDHEAMDRAKYMDSFLRFGPEYRGRYGGVDQGPPYHPRGMRTVLAEGTDLERFSRYWNSNNVVYNPGALSGDHVCKLDSSREFGVTFRVPPGHLPTGRELYLEASLARYEEKPGDSQEALGVVSIEQPDGTRIYYRTFGINTVPGSRERHWARHTYRLVLPMLHGDETVKFYVWNQGRRSWLLLDDLYVRILAVEPYGGLVAGD